MTNDNNKDKGQKPYPSLTDMIAGHIADAQAKMSAAIDEMSHKAEKEANAEAEDTKALDEIQEASLIVPEPDFVQRLSTKERESTPEKLKNPEAMRAREQKSQFAKMRKHYVRPSVTLRGTSGTQGSEVPYASEYVSGLDVSAAAGGESTEDANIAECTRDIAPKDADGSVETAGNKKAGRTENADDADDASVTRNSPAIQPEIGYITAESINAPFDGPSGNKTTSISDLLNGTSKSETVTAGHSGTIALNAKQATTDNEPAGGDDIAITEPYAVAIHDVPTPGDEDEIEQDVATGDESDGHEDGASTPVSSVAAPRKTFLFAGMASGTDAKVSLDSIFYDFPEKSFFVRSSSGKISRLETEDVAEMIDAGSIVFYSRNYEKELTGLLGGEDMNLPVSSYVEGGKHGGAKARTVLASGPSTDDSVEDDKPAKRKGLIARMRSQGPAAVIGSVLIVLGVIALIVAGAVFVSAQMSKASQPGQLVWAEADRYALPDGSLSNVQSVDDRTDVAYIYDLSATDEPYAVEEHAMLEKDGLFGKEQSDFYEQEKDSNTPFLERVMNDDGIRSGSVTNYRRIVVHLPKEGETS